MPTHKVIRNPNLFRRIKKDVARHNERLREAIRKNIHNIIVNENIISSDRDKLLKVPIRRLKSWSFDYDMERSEITGHGDGRGTLIKQGDRPKVQCPSCGDIFPVNIRSAYEQAMEDGREYEFLMEVENHLANCAKGPNRDEYAEGKTGKRRTIPGTILGKQQKGGGGQGNGPQGGEDPGEEFYETDVPIHEVEKILFEELKLPFLEEKGHRKVKSERYKFDDIRKAGPRSHLAKRQTIKESIKRRAKTGEKGTGPIFNDDLRFRSWEVDEEEESCAVVIAMIDSSASMDENKKFLARSFYLWMVRFLQYQYDNVDIVFINHHTEAKECTEEEFFKRGESGGTKFSSAYKLALQVLRERYPTSNWNSYIFHFSDGENWSSDNAELFPVMEALLEHPCNLLGYGEIDEYAKDSQSNPGWWTPYSSKKDMDAKFGNHERFVTCTITGVEDIAPALQKFFAKDKDTSL